MKKLFNETRTAEEFVVTAFLKIYGERNTNTNYITKLIDLNLDVEQLDGVAAPWVMTLQKKLPGDEWLRDLYFYGTRHRNLGWKHSTPQSVNRLKTYQIMKHDVGFISITKNPYSWLLSLYRNPYHAQYRKQKPDFETFLQTPWKTFQRENSPKILKNPIELWNLKNDSYLQLEDLNGLSITSESCFESPGRLIDKISDHFSIRKKNAEFIGYEKSTKTEGKDSVYYSDYYLNEKWRQELSKTAIGIINSHINKELMARYGYQVIP